MIIHYFCHVLLVKSNWKVLPSLREGGIHGNWSLGLILEFFPNTTQIAFLSGYFSAIRVSIFKFFCWLLRLSLCSDSAFFFSFSKFWLRLLHVWNTYNYTSKTLLTTCVLHCGMSYKAQVCLLCMCLSWVKVVPR